MITQLHLSPRNLDQQLAPAPAGAYTSTDRALHQILPQDLDEVAPDLSPSAPIRLLVHRIPSQSIFSREHPETQDERLALQGAALRPVKFVSRNTKLRVVGLN